MDDLCGVFEHEALLERVYGPFIPAHRVSCGTIELEDEQSSESYDDRLFYIISPTCGARVNTAYVSGRSTQTAYLSRQFIVRALADVFQQNIDTIICGGYVLRVERKRTKPEAASCRLQAIGAQLCPDTKILERFEPMA
ncbi:hypothetical protein CEP54_000301 [Fusarium duplospermum]|uniref:Uncharacterized protein n=1 Tax=Fusarium duplospermum TaxID=1325734 RepID=A0A428R6R0_9HYPO|nr:hypothetical protein CEP54_000301 [Fusarium duplospermum]